MPDKDHDATLGLLGETLKTIRDTTAVNTELVEIVRGIKEGINRLLQSNDSRLTEITIADLKGKIETLHNYATALGNLPQQNAVIIGQLMSAVQQLVLHEQTHAQTLTDIRDKSDTTLANTAAVKADVAQLKIDVAASSAKTDELSTWSKVKFPFIIGMITFIVWLASIVAMFQVFDGRTGNKIDAEMKPVLKEIQQLNGYLVKQQGGPPVGPGGATKP
jgi:hypothetical protein